MKLSEAKSYINKAVSFTKPGLYLVDKIYRLTALTVRKDAEGRLFWQAEITDTDSPFSVIICSLEDIEPVKGQESSEMTIDELKAYKTDMAELEAVKHELAGLTVTDSVQSAAKHPYSLHNVAVHGLPHEDRVISLLKRKDVLKRRTERVRAFVDEIEDWQTREMFRLHFIEGKTYTKTAIALGLGHAPDCVKKRIYRYSAKCTKIK